ncbi:DUF1488 family protein [Vibrio cholerae]|uniref:DUF1488 family protein n=1 Tax=Vibrio cholerae TaxID=666 RepID=UPI00226DB399|nr:DUF1488 family protein [Vibrio cholerae]MCX9560811.1 DUF1488 family protein [Vibrio cholerae]
MNIEFTGRFEKNENFGINFYAKVNADTVTCVISTEALQDINPSRRGDDVISQFLSNKKRFESIARNKILKNEIIDGEVRINQTNVV